MQKTRYGNCDIKSLYFSPRIAYCDQALGNVPLLPPKAKMLIIVLQNVYKVTGKSREVMKGERAGGGAESLAVNVRYVGENIGDIGNVRIPAHRTVKADAINAMKVEDAACRLDLLTLMNNWMRFTNIQQH
ncbi:hypothetical protein J6590_016562 [Homalodisca vitripennis]|nr:hypothetical protein J6590_016562 [Homalodisca vitripennis]